MTALRRIAMAILIGLMVAGCAGTGASWNVKNQTESAFPTPTKGPSD